MDAHAENVHIRERYPAGRWWEVLILFGVLSAGFLGRGVDDWRPTAAAIVAFGVCWELTKWRLRRNAQALVRATSKE